ncbi:hypothetical protein [Streptomyces sp. NPDC003688]
MEFLGVPDLDVAVDIVEAKGPVAVFVWSHEDDSSTWVVPSMATYLEWRLTGRIELWQLVTLSFSRNPAPSP